MNTPGYESLAAVLQRAYDQAASGKGAERHACSRPFTEQPMQSISDLLGSHTGLLYQAMKKIQESERMDIDAAIRELLGAINYVAGAIIFLEARRPEIKAIDWAGIEQAQNVGKTATAARQTNQLNTVPEPGRILSEAESAIAIRNLKEQGSPLRLDMGTLRTFVAGDTHWLCYHGRDDVPGKSVRVGEACPTCFAVHN